MLETDKSDEGYVILRGFWIPVTFMSYAEFLHCVVESEPICICHLIIGYC
jgi:hypothetical protein